MPNIRYIKESDVPSFHRSLDVVAKEKQYLIFTSAPPIEGTKSFVLNQIKMNAPHFVLVNDQDEVVGCCDIGRNTRETIDHRGSLGIWMLPEFRGQGWGRKLMLAAIEHSRRIGLEKIDLNVYPHNLNAIALYESLGFQREGIHVRYRKIDGEYWDSISMGLVLD